MPLSAIFIGKELRLEPTPSRSTSKPILMIQWKLVESLVIRRGRYLGIK
jgi:hypothetical protein